MSGKLIFNRSTAICLSFIAIIVSYLVCRALWTVDKTIVMPLSIHRAKQTQTFMHNDPNIWVGEDGSCLSPRDHCDRMSAKQPT